jgi:hypothetical protein
MNSISSVFKNLWFRDTKEEKAYINETAMRIRAGILLFIPIYMSFTLYDAVFVSHWLVDGNTAVDSYDTDWDNNIIYSVEAIKKTYDYTFQSWLLVYALFEMLATMFVTTTRLSPTVLISSFLAHNKPVVWKPLLPKRFAWSIGATFITICWIFFNPEVFAGWVDAIFDAGLSTTENYMSNLIPLTLVWVCLSFMWLEAILGFCVGCKIHALLVKLKVFEEECDECNNLDWDAIAKRNAEKNAKVDY